MGESRVAQNRIVRTIVAECNVTRLIELECHSQGSTGASLPYSICPADLLRLKGWIPGIIEQPLQRSLDRRPILFGLRSQLLLEASSDACRGLWIGHERLFLCVEEVGERLRGSLKPFDTAEGNIVSSL